MARSKQNARKHSKGKVRRKQVSFDDIDKLKKLHTEASKLNTQSDKLRRELGFIKVNIALAELLPLKFETDSKVEKKLKNFINVTRCKIAEATSRYDACVHEASVI